MCQPDQGPEIYVLVVCAEDKDLTEGVCECGSDVHDRLAPVDSNPYLLCCCRTTYAPGSGTTRSRRVTTPSHKHSSRRPDEEPLTLSFVSSQQHRPPFLSRFQLPPASCNLTCQVASPQHGGPCPGSRSPAFQAFWCPRTSPPSPTPSSSPI